MSTTFSESSSAPVRPPCKIATYLASLRSLSAGEMTLSPLEHAPSSVDSWSAGSSDAGNFSPQKRPRADSPDTDASSCASAADGVPYYSPAATSSKVIVRSILCQTQSADALGDLPTASQPPSPGPSSRPLSRRSSTGQSCKSVRFARCTNASVFPALSGEEYDRSPIVPSTEAESLALPKRAAGEAARGWIKCVERERAAAADKAKRCAPHPQSGLAAVSLVEGVHGLVEGGYFVGEERDEGFEEEGSDDMFVDDEEDIRDEEDDYDDDDEDNNQDVSDDDEVEAPQRMTLPALTRDDSSGDDSDGLTIATESEPASATLSITSFASSSQTTLHAFAPQSPSVPALPASPSLGRRTPSPPRGLGLGFGMEPAARAEEGEDDDEVTEEEERAMREREAAEQKQRAKKCRERFGLCALGKYTRAEVFASYDSLGGF